MTVTIHVIWFVEASYAPDLLSPKSTVGAGGGLGNDPDGFRTNLKGDGRVAASYAAFKAAVDFKPAGYGGVALHIIVKGNGGKPVGVQRQRTQACGFACVGPKGRAFRREIK